jgi:hypothetical protein
VTTVRLTAQGRALAREIQGSYEQGEAVEHIAIRLELKIEHIQFLMTVDALTGPALT